MYSPIWKRSYESQHPAKGPALDSPLDRKHPHHRGDIQGLRAVETLRLDDVRRQFETNVFGLVRMCQLVLPGMRKLGRGRIVNIPSMGGRPVFPGGGAYHDEAGPYADFTRHVAAATKEAYSGPMAKLGGGP